MPFVTSRSDDLVLALAAVVVATCVLVATLRTGGGTRRAWLVVARTGWVLFVLVVVALTLSQGYAGGVNTEPFATIRLQLDGDRGVAAWNLLGNLALLVPFSLLARAAWGWRELLSTTAGIALSVTVEVGQLFIGRSADVDDVLLNGVGALLGAALAAVVVGLARRPPPSGAAEDESRLMRASSCAHGGGAA